MDTAFQTWLSELSFDDRKKFVETIFSIFEGAGVVYFDDITSEGFSAMKSIFLNMRNLDEKTSSMVKSFFRALMEASLNEVKAAAVDIYNNVIESIGNLPSL